MQYRLLTYNDIGNESTLTCTFAGKNPAMLPVDHKSSASTADNQISYKTPYFIGNSWSGWCLIKFQMLLLTRVHIMNSCY